MQGYAHDCGLLIIKMRDYLEVQPHRMRCQDTLYCLLHYPMKSMRPPKHWIALSSQCASFCQDEDSKTLSVKFSRYQDVSAAC